MILIGRVVQHLSSNHKHIMGVLDVYADEAVSGKGSKTASRKAYQRMLRDMDRGTFDTILIPQI